MKPPLSGNDTADKKQLKGGLTSAIESIKDVASTFNEYNKDESLMNATSKTLNHYGVLDDVTNTFFKAYDFIQDYPGVVPVAGAAALNSTVFSPHSLVGKTSNLLQAASLNTPLDIVNNAAHEILANKNYSANQNVDLSKYDTDGGYINDQNAKNSKMAELRYGVWDMENNGCEVIATHNALNTLNNRKDIRDIAREFESDGQTLYGGLGTSPYAIGDYFRKNGYNVKTYEGDERIKKLEFPKADSYILSFWNNDRFSGAIHTVSISKQDDGSYKVYNSDGKKADKVWSLQEYLNEERKRGKRVPLVLHCISEKRE